MRTFFECLMLICLCAAVAVYLRRFIRNGCRGKIGERLFVVTVGAGFIVGTIAKIASSPASWTEALYIAGAMLSYTALLFSFPDREHKNKRRR